jgi:3'-phosphoadenosine 5'-phosphosulfate sulfotransferase (PAPS reductase)/FAD synthetase
MKHYISLGAGVQSSTMALMAAHGEITPMPEAAIFADTGDEPNAVYTWLDWLEDQLPFPVIRADRGIALSAHIFNAIDNNTRVSTPPLYTAPENGGREGMLTRDCTVDFKVAVIQRAIRGEMRRTGDKQVVQWIGISLDEVIRMKLSRVKYSEHRWPLIEMRMNRNDCLRWMEKKGYPTPPRSACVYCPHKDTNEWRRLRDEDEVGWQRAVEFDAKIRNGIHKVRQKCYLHRSCKPLAEVDLSTDVEKGQSLLWGNECEGMCGV